jgi:hypothetical protein
MEQPTRAEPESCSTRCAKLDDLAQRVDALTRPATEALHDVVPRHALLKPAVFRHYDTTDTFGRFARRVGARRAVVCYAIANPGDRRLEEAAIRRRAEAMIER